MSNAFTEELAQDSLLRNSLVPPAEIVADEIEAALKQFVDRASALVKAADDRVVTDNDSIGRAADVRSMIATLLDTIWSRAKEVAEPHNRAVATARTRTERFVAELVRADGALNDKIVECRNVQRQRAAAQQQQQRDAEAALRAAQPEAVNPQIDSEPQGPVSLPAVRGDYGTRVHDRAVTSYVYEDVTKLPLDVLNSPGVAKAIQSALRTYARLHSTIPGVTANAALATSTRRPN